MALMATFLSANQWYMDPKKIIVLCKQVWKRVCFACDLLPSSLLWSSWLKRSDCISEFESKSLKIGDANEFLMWNLKLYSYTHARFQLISLLYLLFLLLVTSSLKSTSWALLRTKWKLLESTTSENILSATITSLTNRTLVNLHMILKPCFMACFASLWRNASKQASSYSDQRQYSEA